MANDLNFAPIQEALRWYVKVRVHRTLPYIVNKKMKDVVIKTMANTPTVGRGQISAELQEYYATKALVLTGKRAGQLMKKPKALYRPWPLARAIIAKRMWEHGINPHSLTGQAFADKIDAMIKSRLSSGSYALSGWIPAAKLFGAGSGYGGVGQWTQSGSGILATPDSAIAQIQNDAIVKWDANSRGYREVIQAGQDALDDVAEETLAFVDSELEKGWFEMAGHLR